MRDFWGKVNKTATCWKWQGYINKGGYGQFNVAPNVVIEAHKYAYGEVPAGLVLDHKCRNRACVNPAHLEPVTQRENLLRGDTICAKNASKTHCKNGHEFNEINTQVNKYGKRVCRACNAERMRNARKQRKGHAT